MTKQAEIIFAILEFDSHSVDAQQEANDEVYVCVNDIDVMISSSEISYRADCFLSRLHHEAEDSEPVAFMFDGYEFVCRNKALIKRINQLMNIK